VESRGLDVGEERGDELGTNSMRKFEPANEKENPLEIAIVVVDTSA
jgi:hypothetical protein